MRIVTATEAWRRFSALLDEAERGETFVVTRGGRRVATPSPSANGGAVADFFRSWADYTADVASHHADLMAHTRRTGHPRGAHDLVIAATARATGRTLLTTDARAELGELPGVSVRVVS